MPLLTEITRGVFVISVTPFFPDGAIDWESIDRVDFYREKGADGLTILGMMGEAVNVHSKVTPGDHLKLTHPGGGKAHRRAAPK